MPNLRRRQPRQHRLTNSISPNAKRKREPKKIVYLFGAGATQAEVDYLGASQVNLLMRDANSLEGVSSSILKRTGTTGRAFRGIDNGVDIEKLISLLLNSGVDEHTKLAEKMRVCYFEEIRERLVRSKIIKNPQLAKSLFQMHGNKRLKDVETLSGIIYDKP